jgi:hypothetical protein
MLSDLAADCQPHLRALWNDPFAWMREHWTFLLLVITSAAAVGWWLLGLLTTDAGRFCPGPRPAGFLGWRSILRALWPIHWISHWSSLARCGYDLSHTPSNTSHQQTCPECGQRSTAAEQIPAALGLSFSLRRPWSIPIRLSPTHRPRVFRRDVVAGLTLLACLILWKSPTYRYAMYLDAIPDRVIIIAARTLGNASPDHLEGRLFRCVTDPALSATDADLAIPALIQRLRTDGRSWNGWQSADALGHLLISPDHTITTQTFTALEKALRNPDRQARQLAAAVLRRHLEKFPAAPSPALIATTVEGLDADDLDNRSSWVANANEGVAFLIQHAKLAQPYLASKLTDNDSQGRWLAAVIIARAGLTDLLPQAAPILIEQLRDNDTWGDERVAADALRHFGPPIIPLLTAHFDSSDPQLRTWCGRIVRELREQEQGITPAPILPNRHVLVCNIQSKESPKTGQAILKR